MPAKIRQQPGRGGPKRILGIRPENDARCNLAVTLVREETGNRKRSAFCRPDVLEPMASTNGSLRIFDLL
jgi:hypothetical protein